jgi:hypothetical protein
MKKYWQLMTEQEKADIVRRRIKRTAVAMYNACIKSYKDNNCNGCPFKVINGCNLYGHPIEWKDKINQI